MRAVLLLLLWLATAVGAELPLGAAGLPENRTEEKLAPGLRYLCIQRGQMPREAVYTVQVACCGPQELAFQQQRVKKLGLASWQQPAGDGLVSVRVGRMALPGPAAELEKSLRAQGWPGARMLYTGEDPDADQGPWVIHILEVSPTFAGHLEAGYRKGRTALTELARGSLAAVNGDYFVEREEDGTPGDPTGILLDRGKLVSEAVPGRSALLWKGKAWRIAALLTRMTQGGKPVDGLNRKPGLRRDVAGHDTTTKVANERVVQGTVEASITESGKPIAAGSSAIGGGPALLPVLRHREEGFAHDGGFLYTFGLRRNPRTLAGLCPDGRLLLVVVDGRQPEWSVGLTFEESARLLKALGATQGLNLDGGGSSTMVVRNRIVNRPCEGKPRAIGDALLLKE